MKAVKTIRLSTTFILLSLMFLSSAFGFGDGSSLEMMPGTSYTVDGNTTGELFNLSDPDSLAEFQSYAACIGSLSQPGPGATMEELQQYMNNLMGCLQEISGMPQGAFVIRMEFTTTEIVPDTVTIPAGSVFTPENSGSQPTMTIETLFIEVPANGTISVVIPVFCLAPDKDAPSDGDQYDYSGVVQYACLLQILQILETRNVSTFDFQEISIVQDAIWNCVEGTFGQKDINNLNALPKNCMMIPAIQILLLE